MKSLRAEEGNAALEFVIVAPALLALLALVVAGGRILAIKSAVETVARETARSASQESSPDQALGAIQERVDVLAAELHLDSARLDVRPDVAEFVRGTPMSVRVNYRVLLDDLPAFGLFPGSFVVSARQVETVEKFKSR